MAIYGDIESWAKILNESEESERAWNEACETRKAEAAALDEKDLDGVEEIDPETLGMTETEVDEAVEDVKAKDEEIDFSAYKLDEADDREPIVKAVKVVAPEVSVSTANLTGENSVRLAEAIEKLAEAVDKNDRKADSVISESVNLDFAKLLKRAIEDALRTESDPAKVRFWMNPAKGVKTPCRAKLSKLRGLEFVKCPEHKQMTLESFIKDAQDVGMKLSDFGRIVCLQDQAFCEPTSFDAKFIPGIGV